MWPYARGGRWKLRPWCDMMTTRHSLLFSVRMSTCTQVKMIMSHNLCLASCCMHDKSKRRNMSKYRPETSIVDYRQLIFYLEDSEAYMYYVCLRWMGWCKTNLYIRKMHACFGSLSWATNWFHIWLADTNIWLCFIANFICSCLL